MISTGGTHRTLSEEGGLPVKQVAEVTGSPEILEGRVKTLHPVIHAGLLARRDSPEHMAELQSHGMDTIDLVVVNLYPFVETISKAGVTLADALENIDIGGPTMLRAAALFGQRWFSARRILLTGSLSAINSATDISP